jgi:hypothetical protein
MLTHSQIMLVAAFSCLPRARQLVAIKYAPKTGVNSILQQAAASGFHKGGQTGIAGGPTGMAKGSAVLNLLSLTTFSSWVSRALYFKDFRIRTPSFEPYNLSSLINTGWAMPVAGAYLAQQ